MDPNFSDGSSEAVDEKFWNLANSSSDEELLNLEITIIEKEQEIKLKRKEKALWLHS